MKSASTPPSRPMTGLGRGLSDIIAQGARPATPATITPIAPDSPGMRTIPLSQIVPNPRQPRIRFVDEPLDELVASIREHGILQPITVRHKSNGYEIIAGERRFRACQKAGLAAIPAIVKDVNDAEAYQLALIENLQRENLDPIEEALGYRKLASDFSLTQEQIAQKVGKNRTTITNSMRLLELPEEIQGYVTHGQLSTGHAKAILGAGDPAQQIRIAHEAIRLGLNVRNTEQLVARYRSGSGARPTKSSRKGSEPETPAHIRAIEEALQQRLATRVQLHTSGNGGKIEIQYYTPSDLDRLLEFFQVRL